MFHAQIHLAAADTKLRLAIDILVQAGQQEPQATVLKAIQEALGHLDDFRRASAIQEWTSDRN